MKKKPLLVPILSIILASLFAIIPTSSQPETAVNTEPSWIIASIGSTFQVDITVTDVVNLYGWEINMTFDKAVLNVQTMVEGPFLIDFAYSIGIETWALGPIIDNTVGWVQMACSLWDPSGYPPNDGADGDGVLATVTFEVKNYGRSDLHFFTSKLNSRDPGSGNPVQIPHTTTDGIFDNRIPGDITGPENPPGSGKYPYDGKVDTYDLTYLSTKLGTNDTTADFTGQGPPGIYAWPPDGIVNIYDLTRLGRNFGKHYP